MKRNFIYIDDTDIDIAEILNKLPVAVIKDLANMSYWINTRASDDDLWNWMNQLEGYMLCLYKTKIISHIEKYVLTEWLVEEDRSLYS